MANCIVFVSGKGSNLIKIHQYLINSPHSVAGVITDKPECGGAEYARKQGIPLLVVDYSQGRKEAEQNMINWILEQQPINLLVLAGFMRILSESLIKEFEHKIINIHPTLLPKHPGRYGLSRSIASDDPSLGITIHYVDEGVDTGPIILQESFVRSMDHTFDQLEDRIHQIEHRLYPKVVFELLGQNK
jgi:phosphoribosylglycinamide formyltransferase-1